MELNMGKKVKCIVPPKKVINPAITREILSVLVMIFSLKIDGEIDFTSY
jgi:hypothetical protein